MKYCDSNFVVDYKRYGISHDEYIPRLREYMPDRCGEYDGKSILILPGGGYSMTSENEAEPVALRFIQKGISAFVLNYSVAPNRYPTQLVEVASAIKYIKGTYGFKQLYICGFSAGGHLAAHYATTYQKIAADYKLSCSSLKVDGMILCYPVITADTSYWHKGSFENLFGERVEECKSIASVEHLVSNLTPPAFIWHTNDDYSVSVKNSMLIADSLFKHNIPYELHIYENGRHGLSTAEIMSVGENGRQSMWVENCLEWLKTK